MSRSQKLIDFVSAQLLADPNGEPISADEELLTTGLMDSLGLMRLVTFIGEEFSISIPYEDILIENFRTVRAIDGYLDGRAASAS